MLVSANWLKLRYDKSIDRYYYVITKHQIECIAPLGMKVCYIPCCSNDWPVLIKQEY